jgi:hypothetical protein
MLKTFGPATCAWYVIITLVKPAKAGRAIGSTKHHGLETLASIFRTYRGKAKAYQVKQVLLAIEKLEVAHGTQR